MMTKLSLIDSSSSSLKYSLKTWTGQHSLAARPTEHSLCRKKMTSAALVFLLDSARTGVSGSKGNATHDIGYCVGCACS